MSFMGHICTCRTCGKIMKASPFEVMVSEEICHRPVLQDSSCVRPIAHGGNCTDRDGFEVCYFCRVEISTWPHSEGCPNGKT